MLQVRSLLQFLPAQSCGCTLSYNLRKFATYGACLLTGGEGVCTECPYAGAIQTLCAGGLFDRARQLAGNSAQLLQLIEEQHTQHLVANNDAEELASRGNAAAAVEMFAAQGTWKRAHELVRPLAVLVTCTGL